MQKSSTGLDENVAGLLCYLGWLITGIVFLVLEKESKFVKFHAIQSIIVSAAFIIVYIVLAIIAAILLFVAPVLGILFSILYGILGLLLVILWIICMVKAFQHEKFMLPIAGPMAEKYVK